ncbi:MAG: cation transporter [Xanthobacteraceae bacterium]|nr:cation transporter [Xanthobacteraceae bacterium]MBX3533089.1 cation transporter [Xanthobacteraceae bacterium]MBX3550253.1 cation transporter [Xanthobacteraceae bacterium]MCW5676195.1 cation transporter [Xanthobacteraceae bacterium]MCW5677363.1 cation transporter [Xanthobacteraceae bacterium]
MHGGHDHSHAGHSHGPARYDRAFAIGVALNLGFVAAEFVFGWLSQSLALIADAGHNLSDVAGLLIAWFAAWLSRKPATEQRTYGYRRVSILAALANAALLIAAVVWIVVEAVQRFFVPQPVATTTVIAVAAVGVVINTATALLFMRGREHDINIKGAFLHMAADAAVSLGVVVAGILILYTNWLWLDPTISIVIAIVMLWSTWSLARDSLNLSLDMIPPHIDRVEVEKYLAALPGVSNVHHLHIWATSTTEVALTVHLVRPAASLDDAFLKDACEGLKHRFGIVHATFQIEAGRGARPC